MTSVIKLSKEDIQLLKEALLLYVNSTNHYSYKEGPYQDENTNARILHNAFFDLEHGNITQLEILK